MNYPSKLCPSLYDALLSCTGIVAIRKSELSEAEAAFVLRQYQLYVETFPDLLVLGLTKLNSDSYRLPFVANLWSEHGEGTLARNHRAIYGQMLQEIGSRHPELVRHLSLPFFEAAREFQKGTVAYLTGC